MAKAGRVQAGFARLLGDRTGLIALGLLFVAASLATQRIVASLTAIFAAVALALFLVIELISNKPLLNLRLLLRRNFGFGTLANFLFGFALYGSVFILPQYLSRVQGYNAEQIGMVLAWTGLPQLVLIPLVPQLMKRVDPRIVIAVGFALFVLLDVLLALRRGPP